MSAVSIVGLLAAFLLPIGLGFLLPHLLAHFTEKSRKDIYIAGFGSTASNWITVTILILIIFPKTGLDLAYIGFKNEYALGEIGLALFFTFVSIAFFALISKVEALKTEAPDLKVDSWKHIFLITFYAPITAAFYEEFLYRGYAITILQRELGNVWIAGTVSSTIFSLMHIPRYRLKGFARSFILGLILTILFIFTGSIYPGITVHSTINFIGFVLVPFTSSRVQARVCFNG